MAGERQVRTCRSLRNMLTASKQIPDGLLEVEFANSSAAQDFLIEVAAYPNSEENKS